MRRKRAIEDDEDPSCREAGRQLATRGEIPPRCRICSIKVNSLCKGQSKTRARAQVWILGTPTQGATAV